MKLLHKRRGGHQPERGKEEKAIEAARSFYANGDSIELIAKSLGMTIEQVKDIVTEEVP